MPDPYFNPTIKLGIIDAKAYLNMTLRYLSPYPTALVQRALHKNPLPPSLSKEEQTRLKTLKGKDLEQALKKGEVVLMQATALFGIIPGLGGKAFLGREQTTPKKALEEISKTAPYTLPLLLKELKEKELPKYKEHPKKATLIQELIDYLNQLI